jgi:imidazolonepropionase-like amidohydrolase
MRLSFCLALAALLGCSHVTPLVQKPAQSPLRTVFVDVSLFDGTGVTSVAHQDVWVEGGAVARIGPTGATPIPPDATVIPGAGKTLLAGLVDVHVHTGAGGAPPWKFKLPNPERNLQAYLYCGITSIVDVGGGVPAVLDRRDAVQSGKLLGPHMKASGPHFTTHGGHPVALLKTFVPWPVSSWLEDEFAFQVDTIEEVDAAMDKLIWRHPDLIKVTSDQLPLGVPTIKLEIAKKVVERAHRANMRVAAHVGDDADVAKLLDAGVDLLVHDVYRDKLTDALAERLAAQHVPVAPTLAVFDNIDRQVSHERPLSALTHEVAGPEMIDALEHMPVLDLPEAFMAWFDAVHAHRQDKFDNVARLKAHGVTLLVGSDSPNLGMFAGATFHDELEAMVKAGLTPGEVLHAATGVNAETLGFPDAGRVALGRTADLLLVRGDPTAEIAAIHQIEGVWLGGAALVRTPSGP